MKDITSVLVDVTDVTSFKKRSEDAYSRNTRKEKKVSLESADLETALSEAGFGKYNLLILLIGVPVAWTTGWVTGSVSFVLPAIGCESNYTNFEKAMLQSAPYIGMLLFGFSWGSASDSFGRQKLIAYGFILDGVFGLLAAMSPNLWLMMFFKTLSGGMNCGPSAIFMTYLSETFCNKYKKFAFLSTGLFSAFGNTVQPVLGLLITWYLAFEGVTVYGSYTFTSWRLYLVLSTFPSLISGFGSLLLFESPKFLMQRGKFDEALNVCRSIYVWNTGLPSSSYPVQKIIDVDFELQSNKSEDVPKHTFLQRVGLALAQSSALFKKPFVVCALMIFIIQFGAIGGLNVLRLWLPQIFTIVENVKASNFTGPNKLCDILEISRNSTRDTSCGANSPSSLNNMLIINSFLVVGHVIFMSTVKYLGKKTPVAFTTMTAALFAAGMIFVPVEYIVYPITIFVCLLNVSFYAISFLVAETFPTSLRAVALNVTQLCGRVGVMVSLPIVSQLMFSHCYFIIPGVCILLLTIGTIAILLPIDHLMDEQKKSEADIQ